MNKFQLKTIKSGSRYNRARFGPIQCSISATNGLTQNWSTERFGVLRSVLRFLRFRALFREMHSKLNTAKYCVVEKTLKSYYEEKYRVNCKKLGMKKRELLEGMKQILGDLAVPLYKRIVWYNQLWTSISRKNLKIINSNYAFFSKRFVQRRN